MIYDEVLRGVPPPDNLEAIFQDFLRRIQSKTGLRGVDIQVDFRLWNELLRGMEYSGEFGEAALLQFRNGTGTLDVTPIDYASHPEYTEDARYYGSYFFGGTL